MAAPAIVQASNRHLKCVGAFELPLSALTRQHCPRRCSPDAGGGIFIEMPRLLICPAKALGSPLSVETIAGRSDEGRRQASRRDQPVESGPGKAQQAAWKRVLREAAVTPNTKRTQRVGGCGR